MRLHLCGRLSIAQQLDAGYRIGILCIVFDESGLSLFEKNLNKLPVHFINRHHWLKFDLN